MNASPKRLRDATILVLTLLAVGGLAKLYTRATEDHYALAAAARLRVDLNLDQVENLVMLPQIGPTLAHRIIQERTQGGPFTDLDDVRRRVSGLGDSIVDELKECVSFGTVTDSTSQNPTSTDTPLLESKEALDARREREQDDIIR